MAWNPLGWKAAAFAEIEKFPSAVLAHHYPDVPNLGDMTRFQEWPDLGSIDLLCGGTPCQSFSVAGLRKGLDDPRGDLMLTFGAIAAKHRPRWLVWENVPGVLSSNGGRDFGAFLGLLGELGYGFAYRVLDAQYFGLAQRRKRVFVVGCLGDWRRAAAVLFERHSLQGHPAPSRQAREDVARCLTHGSGGGQRYDGDSETFITGSLCSNGKAAGSATQQDAESGMLLVTHALTGEGFDASEDGTGRGTPLVPVAYSIMPMNSGKDYKARDVDVAQPLMAVGPVGGNQGGDFIVQPLAFDTTHITSEANYSSPRPGDPCHPLAAGAHPPAAALNWQAGGKQTTLGGQETSSSLIKQQIPGVQQGMQVRRLTPEECEALQGFPRGYTLIPYRGKPAADGPRYKALGNSWAVPVARWVGERIAAVDSLAAQMEAA